MKQKKIAVSIALLLISITMRAAVNVTAKIDSIAMFIGEQVHLTLSVSCPKDATVEFPTVEPRHYLQDAIEIVDVSKADTVADENDHITVSKVLTLTCFDERLYSIAGLKVKVNGTEYTSNQLALKVVGMEVDTLHLDQFFPPKDVQDNPFDWNEWRGLFYLSIVTLLLVVVWCYLIIRLKQNKPIITRIRIVKKIPPHQKALQVIEQLKGERLNDTDNQKVYYTRLTDALRQYIVERFGFNAMEMTSSEILDKLQASGDATMMNELTELFRTADLVKFAKYSTLLNENDLNLVNAINFIDQTKIEGKPTEERIVPQLSETDKRTQQNRIVIKTLIYATAAVIVLALGYIVYNACLLMI